MPSRERRTGKETTQVGPGEAFKEGRCLTVTLTLAVELDTEKGEVSRLHAPRPHHRSRPHNPSAVTTVEQQ